MPRESVSTVAPSAEFAAVRTRALAAAVAALLDCGAEDVPAVVVEEDVLLPQAARPRAAARAGRRHPGTERIVLSL
jgi:hypothetical protein